MTPDEHDPLDTTLLPDCADIAPSGGLVRGGRDVVDVVAQHGTPLFVYDLAEIRRNFQTARRVFGPGVAYATKAFVSGEIVALAAAADLSLDVSTDGEYELARAADFPTSRLVVHGNNKSDWLLESAVKDGVQWIVIDSRDELERLAALCERLGVAADVLVRVNPGIEVHTHEYIATGNRDSKFGVPAWDGQAAEVLAQAARTPALRLRGVHAHIGSLVYSLDNVAQAMAELGAIVAAVDVDVAVVGGGLGVRYLNGDVAPSFEDWAATSVAALRDAGFAGRVLAEPGRCLVAKAALTVYAVGAVKDVSGETIVAVDGGMSDNPRPILYGSGYEVAAADDLRADRPHVVRVVGSHCESGDMLVARGWLPRRPAPGDLLVTPVTGAYGYSMASNYNRMRRPAVVFVDGDQSWVGLERERFEDLRARDTWFRRHDGARRGRDTWSHDGDRDRTAPARDVSGRGGDRTGQRP